MQKLKRFICLLCVCLLLATCCFTVACKDEVTSEDVFKKLKRRRLLSTCRITRTDLPFSLRKNTI